MGGSYANGNGQVRTAPGSLSPARGWFLLGPEPGSRVARARGPGPAPRPSLCASRRCAHSGSPYTVPEAPHSPGSRAGPGAAAPGGHALSTRTSALALPVVAASACALRAPRSDSAKNNKSPPPAARRRLPRTDTASGIARRSASPPRPRRGHAPWRSRPCYSRLFKATPSLAGRRRHAPGGHAPCCPQSLAPPGSFHVRLSGC